MTVAELIAHLQTLPQNAQVVVCTEDSVDALYVIDGIGEDGDTGNVVLNVAQIF